MKRGPNGCGPWWLGTWIPDGPDNEFLCPCNRHDLDYDEGGRELDRWRADWFLLVRCVNNLARVRWYLWVPGLCWALFFYLCVVAFGWTTFNYKRLK